MTGRRRRGLTEEDKELWAFVTREVEPLKRRRRRKPLPKEVAAPAAVEATPEPPPSKPAKAARPAPVPKPPAPKPPPLTPLAALDRHERRRIVRGTKAIDGRIDLHGMRQDEAHGALRGFLHHAQAHGHSMVLVITGKGAPGDRAIGRDDERGVLRRVVPQWLRLPDLRGFVVGFEEAHQGHGGSGALYVRLRRSRRLEAP
jgi:DNA-nicking Smr family endonuclease